MTAPGRPGVQIRLMAVGDWEAVKNIYAQGIATGNATFEEHVPSKADFFAARIPELCLVAVDAAGALAGWAAASPTSTRAAYRGVVEHSIYVSPDHAGRGVATLLLAELIERARKHGYWTVQSGILAENTASLALHAKAGFREVGHRERIAKMNYGPWAGQWRDTILCELRLD